MHSTTSQQSSVRHAIPNVGGNFEVDPAILSCFPEGTKVLKASTYGKSAWTRTGRIVVELQNGESKSYFLKCATEGGAMMMEGEYNSMQELYKVVPSFVPQPHSWGKFQLESPETHFFLCDFIEIDHDSLPDPSTFCTQLATLHLTSTSPTGQFGFHVPNCHGAIPQPLAWDPSWASFFARILESFFSRELDTNGPWPVYEEKFQEILTNVIPQLLEPLQAEGRELKPCLVHGDLWTGNAATNLATGVPIVFDAACFYAHNEYELGTWRRRGVGFNTRVYFEEYRRRVPPSEPVAQYEDRRRLYALKFLMAHMIGWPGAVGVREEIYSEMCYLAEKYPA